MILQKTCMGLAILALTGCATVSPDGQRNAVAQLVQGKTGGVDATLATPNTESAKQVDALLAQPVTGESAVRIALLNNPGLQAAFAQLAISDADRAQAGRLPNPHLSLGALRENELRTINRAISFDILGLLTLPWRNGWQSQQTELAKLQAAQEVVRLAADTRKAWINAVAAQQTAAYMRDVKQAAEAGAELARRMARVGNWSRLRQAQEQITLADATGQLARAELLAKTSRERLTRLMGLWGEQTNFSLASRLPDLPQAPREINDVEAQAIAQRLDVKSAVDESRYIAGSLGYTEARGYLNALSVGYERNSIFNNATGERAVERGPTLDLELPIFDWGSSRNAKAQAIYMQSVARVSEVASTARSEAREAYFSYRTAYDLAVAYRDEVVPLRKFIADETVLRYNGMFASLWDMLGEAGKSVLAVNSAIEAQRDFWIAETDLQTALTATSPGLLQGLQPSRRTSPTEARGH
jgi:outer membrane protein, multidrug efflux system